MKAVYCKLRLALLILFICSISKELVAQNPIIISNSYVMEVEGGVEVQAFGVFLANPISVTIGGCDCVPVPGKSNNPNFITCFVSQSCGDVSGQMTVVTPTGQGTNGPIFTLDFPEVIRSMPYMVVDEETVPDSLIHQIRIKALGDEENLRIERGYFEWSVATPLPSPLPTTRFSSRSTNNESSQVPFDYTDEQFQSAMDEIEYHVRVDSTLLDDVTADGISKKRKRTYFTLAAEFPTPQYPGYFGLGLTWGENIDNLSHSPTMTVDADFDVVASGEVYSMNLYSANFYEVFGLEHEQSYEQTGLLKYLPNFLFTMDQINGPFPTAHFANISFHNPGGVTDYLEGRTLEIATPQVYKKYMGTTVVDETISSNFYLKNLTDSILDYESIEVVFSGDDASSFSVTQQPATDVAVGAQSLFTVSFTPTSSEPRQEATLTINTDDKSYYSFPIIGFVAPDVTVEITSSLSPSTQEATIPIQIQFSEEVTGFEASDLAVVNASVSDFATQDNVTFTANLTPIAEGDITVNVPEASAVNQSNFSNKAASEFSIKYDLTAPEVTTVTLEDSPAKDAQEITYKVMFSEAVQNITLDDFQVDLIEGFAEGIVTQAEKVNETEVLVKVTVIGSLYNKADQVIRLGISQDHNIADLAGHRLLDFDPTQIPTHTTNLTEDETSGTLNLILEDDDVPSVSPFRLNTLSLSVLIPNLGQYYPHGNPVKLVAELDSLSPNISYYTGNENLVYESELKLSVYVLNTDTDAFEKAVDISGTVNITAGADDVALDSLGYTMSSIKFNNLKASNSTIGNINTIILGFKLNLASAGLVSAINKRWEKLRYPLSPVRVNEVKYKEDDSEEIEFIELYDGGLGNVTFKNVLVDILEKSGPFNFQIPMTTNDEGYYVLGSSNTPNASSTALDSLNFYGGTIYFWTQQFKFSYEFDIDRLENMFQVELGEQYSYGRFPQDVATTRNNNSGFYYGLPTPGKPNTIFLVPDTLKLSENSTTLDIDAFGGDASDREAGVTYTLTGGADQSLFNIDESTGVLSFLAAPDFENPTDSDSDNEYLVEVTASRAAPINDSDVRLFKVEVLDVDEIAPSLTITSSVNEFTNREFTATFTFSEDVSGFELEDISVTNGTASDFATVSADVYTATISPSAEGLVTVAVAANVAADLAGNLNTAATSISITHDQTAPQVLSVRLEDSPGKESQEITYRVSFSEAIDSLTLDDFQMDLVSGFAEGIITQAVPQENNEVLVKATIIGSLYNQADQVLRLGISPDNNLVDKAGNALMEYNNETIPTYTTNLTNDNTAGTLNLVLNDEDIPEGSPFRLNTASLGLLIPQLAGAYPNANPVQLHFTLRDFNPNESIYSGSENLANESSFTMDFLVEQGDGSFTQVLTVDGEIDFVFSISEVSDAELAYSMSSLNLKNLEASNSSIGLVNAFLLTFKLNLAEVGLVTAINNSGFRELRYPRTPVKINEIKLKNDGSGEIEFLELYDGGIGNVSNLKLTTFSSYVDIVTDENGYFVLGTSATPNVSNPFFDDHKVVIKNTFSLIFGEGVIDHPLGQGVALEIERLSGLDDLVFNNNFSLQRFPQNEAVRDNATQFFSGMPTPGKPNTIFLVPDTLKLSENSTTLDIDAFGGDASDREAGVTYTITGGADQSLFNIDESTGVLSFLAAPDFENPTDSDSDNEYLVEVTASRAAPINDSDVRLFKVEVLDVDEIAPSLTITSSVNEFTNREFTATFTFSEDVSGFELEDISVTNGTASDFATVSADVYTATISPSAEGLVTVAVSANVAADLAGNLNTAATSISVTNDQTAPTLVSATKGSGTQIILTFSEKVKIDEADANNFIVENVNNNQLCVLSLEDGTAEDNQLILGFDDLSSAHIKLTITYNPSIGDIRDLAGNSLAADATGVEVALNEAPTVTDVEITGDLIVGQTLTGTYTFTDGNSDPESGSTYQWYMADDANGNNKAAISGATSATYVLTSDHVGKYFSFEVTPSDGHVFGTAQESSLQGPVSKIAQSITFNALEAKTYGDEDFELTATASSNLTVTYTSSNTNVATVSGSTVSIIGVGETTITASQAGNDSYLAATNATQTLTIEKATLTATADDKSKTYGEENPALTISYTGFVNGDDETAITQPTASTTADAGSDAGTYAITLSGGAADNYSLTTVNGTLTIGKATLTARADDKERAVGQENPEFTISYTGFVNGDDKSEIDTEPTASTTADETTAAGTAAIVLSGGSDNNYSFNLVEGTLTIVQASFVTSVTVPDDGTYAIGDEITFTVNFALPVTITGNPSLPITVGTETKAATLNRTVNESNTATFTYTIAEGDLDADGIALGTSIDLNEGTIEDGFGKDAITKLNNIASTANIKVDGIRATPTLSSGVGTITNTTFTVTVTYDEPVSGLTAEDLTVTNGTASNVEVVTAGRTWKATITPTADGTTTVSVTTGAVTDAAGNASVASTASISTTFDGTAPTVTSISRAEADQIPTGTTNTNFTVVFSENVTGVDVTDFETETTGTATAKVNTVTAVDGKTYTVNVNGITGEGTIGLNAKDDDSIIDAATNPLAASFTGQVYTTNFAPTGITISSSSIQENNAVGAEVGTLSSTDANTGDSHSYTLVSGTGDTDNASFTIDGDKLLAAETFDFEAKNSYSIRVKTDDGFGATFEKALAITITNEGEAIIEITGEGDFAQTALGLADTKTWTVSNKGDAATEVRVISSSQGFSFNPGSVQVGAGESREITAIFSPSEAKVYSGVVVFNYDVTDEIQDNVIEVNLTGEGVIVTSIDKGQINEEQIRVFPNPANSYVTIDLSELSGQPLNIRMIDPTGVNKFEKQGYTQPELSIDVTNFESGLYIIQFSNERSLVRKKVLIKK